MLCRIGTDFVSSSFCSIFEDLCDMHTFAPFQIQRFQNFGKSLWFNMVSILIKICQIVKIQLDDFADFKTYWKIHIHLQKSMMMHNKAENEQHFFPNESRFVGDRTPTPSVSGSPSHASVADGSPLGAGSVMADCRSASMGNGLPFNNITPSSRDARSTSLPCSGSSRPCCMNGSTVSAN